MFCVCVLCVVCVEGGRVSCCTPAADYSLLQVPLKVGAGSRPTTRCPRLQHAIRFISVRLPILAWQHASTASMGLPLP